MTRRATPDVLDEGLRANVEDGSLAAMFGPPASGGGGRTDVPLSLIDDNPFQERSEYGDLTDLANDIREHGLLQAPVARQARGRYELAFGHRRKRACELAGMTTMPVVIRKLSDEEMATIAFSENEQRMDVTAIDKAVAIQTMQTRFGWSQQQIADKLSLSRPTVSNLLRMLQLPEEVQAAVVAGKISARQADALVPLAALPADASERVPEWNSVKVLLREAVGGMSSDQLRVRATEGVNRVTRRVPDHWNNRDFGELEGVEAARCTECRLAIKRNDELVCQTLGCWERKSTAWQAIKNAETVAATGVPMAPEKVTYDQYDTLYSGNLAVMGLEPYPAPPARPCENLRLRRSEYGGGKTRFEYLCYHPGKSACSCLQAAERAAKKDGTAAWKVIRTATAAVLSERLAEMEIDALRLMAWQYGEWKDREQVYGWTAEQCIPVIAKALIKQSEPYDAHKVIAKARAAMEDLLRLAGVTVMPWSLAGQVEAGEGDGTMPVL